MQRLLLLLAILPMLAQAAPPIDLPPPPPPPATDSGTSKIIDDDVVVKIVEEKEATITEYRARGKLYMIKVTPKIGLPYFLIDNDGTGKFDRGDSPANGNLVVPRWTLFEF